MVPIVIAASVQAFLEPHAEQSGLVITPCRWTSDARRKTRTEYFSIYMRRELDIPIRNAAGSEIIRCVTCGIHGIGEVFPDTYLDIHEVGPRAVIVNTGTVIVTERLRDLIVAAHPDVFAPRKIPLL